MANEQVLVEFNADTAGFDTGINGMVQRLGGPGKLALAGAVAAAGAVIAKFAADSLAHASSLDNAMKDFQVSTGASAEEAERFHGTVRELFRSNTDDLEDLADSVTTVRQRWGDLGDQMAPVTQSFLDFAKVTGQDTSTAIDKVTNVMRTFNMPIEEASGLMDKLTAASQATGAPIDTLTGALASAAPTMDALNMSMDEGIAMLASFEQNGVSAETATRGLRNIIQRTVDPTDAQQAALSQLNIDLHGMEDPSERAASALEQLTQRLGEGELSAADLDAATTLLGRRAGVDMVRAMQDGGAGIEELMGILQNSEGTVSTASETFDKKLGERWTLITRNYLEPFMNVIGGVLLDALEGLLDNVDRIAAGLTAAWEWVSEQFNAMFTSVDGESSELQQNLSAIFEALGSIFESVMQGMVTAWDTILKPAIETIEPLIRGTFEAAGTIIETVLGTITHLLEGVAALLRGDFKGAWESVSAAVRTIVQGLASAVGSIFSGLWEMIGSGIVNTINTVIERVNSMIDAINNALEIRIPDISFTIPNPFGKGKDVGVEIPDINPPDIPHIPKLAKGGVVDSATLALIGEAGPEAVIPLDRLGDFGGGDQTIIVELDGRRIAESTVRHAPGVLRLHGV